MILVTVLKKNSGNIMYIVDIWSEGVKKKAKIAKLFLTEGPFCLYQIHDVNGFPKPIARLDNIKQIEVVEDLSTSKTIVTTEANSTTTASTGNLVKRAVIGGVLLGPTGAIIGGVTGTKNTKKIENSEYTEKVDYLVNINLIFKDGMSIVVKIDNPEVTDLLCSYLGVETVTDDELIELKQKALDSRKKVNKESLRYDNFLSDQAIYEQAKQIAIKNLSHLKPIDHESLLIALISGSVAISLIVSIVLKNTLNLGWIITTITFLLLSILIFFPIYTKQNKPNKDKNDKYLTLLDEEIFRQVQSLKEKTK